MIKHEQTKDVRSPFTGPDELAERMARPFQSFFQREASSGLVLIAATAVALVWANSPLAHTYRAFWHAPMTFAIGPAAITKELAHWVDEGLMALFFFTVGLEVKRELLVGELASAKRALLPVSAAIGGMAVPALLYYALNTSGEGAMGWGIPMATDIAFALGAVALLGPRIPRSIRVFLSAFAIADDIGAVFVIAVFYQHGLDVAYLLPCALAVTGLLACNVSGVRRTLPYALIGIALWLGFIGLGVHATVAGIVVAMFIPSRGKYSTDRFLTEAYTVLERFQCAKDGCGHDILMNPEHQDAVVALELACHNVETPLQRLEHALHPWVAFAVMPLFALANAGITFEGMDIAGAVSHPVTMGIVLGLVVGKPVGIVLMSALAVRARLATLPDGVTWMHIFGVGILGGIGFTMSLFVAGLSFPSDHVFYDYARLGILMGSVVAGLAGMAFLAYATPHPEQTLKDL